MKNKLDHLISKKINLLIEINQIDATTLMWKDGLSEWLPAIQIDEFKTSF